MFWHLQLFAAELSAVKKQLKRKKPTGDSSDSDEFIRPKGNSVMYFLAWTSSVADRCADS